MPTIKISTKKFSLSPNVGNKTKLDDLIETVNSGTSITFRTIANPVIITGEDCLIPFEIIPATLVVGNPNTVATISSGDQTTYIGGTGKKIYVGSLFESLYEPTILYRKDNGPDEDSTNLDSIRINTISLEVGDSYSLGMRKSGLGISDTIEYNTEKNFSGEWTYYFKDDLRNAKMEFINNSHLDTQITQIFWQGQYHQIANQLEGR